MWLDLSILSFLCKLRQIVQSNDCKLFYWLSGSQTTKTNSRLSSVVTKSTIFSGNRIIFIHYLIPKEQRTKSTSWQVKLGYKMKGTFTIALYSILWYTVLQWQQQAQSLKSMMVWPKSHELCSSFNLLAPQSVFSLLTTVATVFDFKDRGGNCLLNKGSKMAKSI